MKRIIFCVMAIVLIAGAAFAKEYEYKKKAGEYDVTIALERSPSVGQNNVTVYIRDAAGRSITDANVAIEYSMPAMPGMAPMNYKTQAVRKGDSYQAKINLSMAGPWTVNARITRGGKTQSAKINVDAR